MSHTLHNVEHFLASAFNFFCNPLSPRRRITTRIWVGTIVLFTAVTTVFMLGCVCTDQWEITTYDYRLLNQSIYKSSLEHGDRCTVTETRYMGDGLLIITTDKRKLLISSMDNNGSIISSQQSSTDQSLSCQEEPEDQNVSLAYRQYGNAFRLCLDVNDVVWMNITRLCAPLYIDRCMHYTPANVKSPFCCKRCLYSQEEVQELDENGNTTFEPIFTVIGFLIVCLVVLCACHVLALIALWKRLVPVVMFTGILFLVSGTFMAFCLAAHQYKVSVMNMRRRSLPHATYEMSMSSNTVLGWSVDSGWMGFAFSVLTGILWIRFSFHLASETTYYKIRPTMNIPYKTTNVNQRNSTTSGQAFAADTAGHNTTNGYAGTAAIPKSVRWAVHSGKETVSTSPNTRPNSPGHLLHGEQNAGTGTVSDIALQHESTKLPMMVEDTV